MTTNSSELSPQDITPPAIEINARRGLIQRLIGSSIRVKTTVAAIILGIVPLLAIGGQSFMIADRAIRQQTTTLQQERAQSIATRMNRFILERYGDVQVLASLAIFTDEDIRKNISNTRRTALLDKYIQTYGVYDSIALLDLNGDVVVKSTGKLSTNHKDRDYFQEPFKTGKPFISPPATSRVTGETVVHFSAPVKDTKTKQIIGVIRTRMPVKYLENLITESGLSKETEWHLIAPDGKYFAAVEKEDVGRLASEFFPVIDEFKAKNQLSNGETTNQVDGVKQVISFAPLSKIEGLVTLNWQVLIAENSSNFYAPQRNMSVFLLLGTGIATLSVFGIASWLAQKATQPIIEATDAVEKLGQGDLQTRVPVRGTDELAVLGMNINNMANQIESLLVSQQESSAQIEEQNQLIVQETEVLQGDIAHLLDIVSYLGEGDLTVQAEVNDRATGLISDTLNRLIEDLNQVISVVLSTARDVNQGAQELEKLSASTTKQVEQQAESVVEVKSLMENVSNLSQETAQQATISDRAVKEAQTAVQKGQEEIQRMNQGIVSLQEGTEQIVKRSENLTDFITLASQFAQDQKRVAALTRVLAFNASTIASRASEQQDPEQFASVAKEFDTIATQVNDLAVQTNQSLVLLQERTDRIQTVVSGISQDVKDISNSVNEFTLGVTQSSELFNKIRTITEKVNQVGQQVTESSQSIAQLAQTTLEAVENISSVTTETELRSRYTNDQAELMDRLTTNLLTKVEFFRLLENNSQ